MQAYLAAGWTAERLLAAAELDWRDNERMKFLLSNLVAAAAPSEQSAHESGGVEGGHRHRRPVRRPRRACPGSDLAAPPRVPSMVEPGAFEVGKDLAATPGAVVHRTGVFELIQYQPVTDSVQSYPLVIVPPMINKFYVTDLAPGRSMIEYLVGQGHQVFVISWRNPDRRHRDWNLDTYGGAVVAALEAACAIAEAPRASICALCSGGIVSAMVAAYLNETGRAAAGQPLPRRDRSGPVTGWHRRRSGRARPRPPRRRRRPAAAGTSTAGRWPRYSPGSGPTT